MARDFCVPGFFCHENGRIVVPWNFRDAADEVDMLAAGRTVYNPPAGEKSVGDIPGVR